MIASSKLPMEDELQELFPQNRTGLLHDGESSDSHRLNAGPPGGAESIQLPFGVVLLMFTETLSFFGFQPFWSKGIFEPEIRLEISRWGSTLASDGIPHKTKASHQEKRTVTV